MKELRVIFTGSVQGVGFRAAAKRLADTFSLVGFARNLDDGTVELVVQGKQKELEEYLSKVKEIFKKHIQKIDAAFSLPTKLYGSFNVK